MKIVRQAGLLFVASFLLSGCAHFFDIPGTGGGGCTTNCPTVTSGVFYVLNSNAGQAGIAAYSVVASKLTALTGSPYTVASGPYAMAVAPNNHFLYVSSQSGIYLYNIGAAGALTLASTTPIATDFAAYSLRVDATGAWLLWASGTGVLVAAPLNSTDGTISTTGKVQQLSLASITPHQLAISPDNANVLVALGTGGTVVVPFSASSTTPLSTTASTVIAPKSAQGAAISVAVDPTNRLVYIGELAATSATANTGGLRAFLYSSLTGTPSEITGSPFATGGLTPASILPAQSGTSVYVANQTVSGSSSGSISGFTLAASGSSYSLTALASMPATGASPAGLAEDSTSSVVLLVNAGGNPDLDVFSFDTTTAGLLDSVLTSSTGTDPVAARAIVAAP